MKNILLIGLGRFGRYTAMKLRELGHQVMAIDKDETKVDAAVSYVTNAMIGDSTNPDFLDTLGIENFDICVVGIGDDFQSSLETTVLLKERGAKYIVARASKDVQQKLLRNNGADVVLYLEKMVAESSALCYSSDHILDYIAVSEDHAVYEITPPEAWLGKSLTELNIRRRYQINVIAVKQDGALSLDISPDAPIAEGQTLLVIAKEQDVLRCTEQE